MMKILHTADIHIRQEDDERWRAFSEITKLAESEGVDVLVISGDLFDSNADANKLRPKFRQFFSGKAVDTLIIAGNHDANAYSENVFLGEKVTIFKNPLAPIKINEVTFWGFPFQDLRAMEVLQSLKEMDAQVSDTKTNILLFHGELVDISGIWENYGAEGRRRYLPVKLEYFKPMKWDYILAGHFHTNFNMHQIDHSKYFVYPGSPISITQRELGPRKVNLFEVGKPPQAHQIKTPYFESLKINLNPFMELDLTEIIQKELASLPDHARLLLQISGYFDRSKIRMSEQELHSSINHLMGDRAESIRLEFRDIHEILEDDLFQKFHSKLESSDLNDPEKQKIRELTIRAMMEL